MRRIKLLLSFVIGAIALISCDKEDLPIGKGSLPATAQTVLSKYFSDLTVAHVYKEYDDFRFEGYEVVFTYGGKVSFDKNGAVQEVELYSKPVPDGIVLEPILAYVKANYKDYYITELSKDKFSYEITLSNRLELLFNLSGGFMYIDN